jgi:Family of unknown function (DUF5681)
MANNDSGEYEVGRGKPPRDTRFRKGQSGNPGGRPRGSGNVDTLLLREVRKKVAIVADGQRKKITKLEAALCQLVNGAASGKLRHIQLLTKLLPSMEKAQKLVSRGLPKLTQMSRKEYSREVLRILRECGGIREDDYAENTPSSADNSPVQLGAPALPDRTKS